jgi:hypothetical protein
MKHLLPLVFFLMAALAIYIGITGGNFYPGTLGRRATGKPIPRWFGRTWFFTFAGVALYMAWRSLR